MPVSSASPETDETGGVSDESFYNQIEVERDCCFS